MTRFTKKALKEQDPIVAGFIQYLEQNGFDVSKANPVSEAKVSEAKAGKAKRSKLPAELFNALEEHYEDYEGSELAEASRQKFGKANLRCIMLTWALKHKQPSVTEFVGKKQSKELRSWYKRQVA